MDLSLDEHQSALGAALRSLLDDHCGPDATRAMIGDRSARQALWSRLLETGVFDLRVTEAEGGLGLGMAEATIVFEELGRAVAPGPILWTHLVAGLVPGASRGTTAASGVIRSDRMWVVENPETIDGLVVLDDGGAWWVSTAELLLGPTTASLDPLVPVAVAKVCPQGERLGGADLADRLYLEGSLLAAAAMVGIAGAATDLATDYARVRNQFGRPVGSFQAIKHLLADDLTGVVIARAAVHAAAAHLDHAEPGRSIPIEARRAVHSAQVCSGEAAVKATKDCIQVHGGIGFTDEAHPHLLAKRAQVMESAFGGVDHQALALYDLMAEPTSS